MNFSEQLEKIFVTEEEIPGEFKLPSENNKHLFNEIVSHEDSNFLSTKFIF